MSLQNTLYAAGGAAAGTALGYGMRALQETFHEAEAPLTFEAHQVVQLAILVGAVAFTAGISFASSPVHVYFPTEKPK